MNRLHCLIKKLKNILSIYHLIDLQSFTLKPGVDTSLERINVKNGLIKLYCVWSDMFT